MAGKESYAEKQKSGASLNARRVNSITRGKTNCSRASQVAKESDSPLLVRCQVSPVQVGELANMGRTKRGKDVRYGELRRSELRGDRKTEDRWERWGSSTDVIKGQRRQFTQLDRPIHVRLETNASVSRSAEGKGATTGGGHKVDLSPRSLESIMRLQRRH